MWGSALGHPIRSNQLTLNNCSSNPTYCSIHGKPIGL